jgi:hypothetical protein
VKKRGAIKPTLHTNAPGSQGTLISRLLACTCKMAVLDPT